jgi:hypothetical protein
MQIKVGDENSERRSLSWDSRNCKFCRILRMKQSRSMFYREEQTGGEIKVRDEG